MASIFDFIASVWDTVNGRVKTDGSGVTQPVSGTVTANQGTAHASEKWRVSVIDGLPNGSNPIGKTSPGIPYGATRVKKTVTATTAQTGTAIITPTEGKTLHITYVQIQTAGTTAGDVQVWYGASGDTTYSRGTDAAIFDGTFAPSATLKPGFVTPSGTDFTSDTADDVLRYTTSAGITITITAWGWEV